VNPSEHLSGTKLLKPTDILKSVKFLVAFLVSVSLSSGVMAASRGLSVEIRASEAPDAPVSEALELYANSYALVIGNDAYNNGWPKLSKAIEDAEIVASELEKKGFEVELYRNLDSDGLSSAFKKFFILKGDDPGARLFVWFAGHGATIDGEGYLIPIDAPVPNDGPQFKYLSVALRDFGTYMRQSVSKHVYAVFDSCFAGTVFSSQRSLPPAAITRATTLPVRQFLTSGDADQAVSDDGAFRELFVRAINGEERSDANGDGYVTASELGIFLGDRVTNLTQSQQTPRYGKLRDKNFDRGDFVFRLPNGPTDLQLTNTSTGTIDNSAEVAFWDSIKDSNNGKEFDAYLKQYPRGSFAGLAKIKKSTLQQKLAAAKQRTRPKEAFKIAFIDKDLQATKTANIRQTPFPTAQRTGRLDPGDRVWGVGEATTRGGNWYKVARDGTDLGFVYAPLLASVGNIDEIIGIDQLARPMPAGAESLSAQTSSGPGQATQAGEIQAVSEGSGGGSTQSAALTTDSRLSSLVDGLIEEATSITEDNTDFDHSQSIDNDMGLEPGSDAFAHPNRQSGVVQADQNKPVEHQPAEHQPVEQGSQQLQPQDTDTVQLDTATVASPISRLSDADVQTQQGLSNAVELAVAQLAAARQRESDFTKSRDEQFDQGTSPAASTPETTPLESQLNHSTRQVSNTAVAAAPGPVASSDRQRTVNTTSTVDAGEAEFTFDNAGAGNAGAGEAQPGVNPAITEKARQKPPQPSLVSGNSEPAQVPAASKEVSDYLKRYLEAAESGNSKAQFSLGYIYETGQETPKDITQAVRWYRHAADADELQAMIRLGLIFENGTDVPQDLTEAAHWYRKAATGGHADAQQTIGYMYENGSGVIKDPAEAARWYERAAAQGRVAAQNNLGRLYQLGIGVDKNLDRAIFWYEKAASQGSQAARNNLADLIPGR